MVISQTMDGLIIIEKVNKNRFIKFRIRGYINTPFFRRFINGRRQTEIRSNYKPS